MDDEFTLDWDASPLILESSRFEWDTSAIDDWEERYREDTTGFVSDPLTTSFTDLDLRPALLDLGSPINRADFESWSD